MIPVLAEGGTGQGSPIPMLIMMGLLFVVMWVVMIRPQQKRQKELARKIESLKKGDKIVTIGGLHGMVNHVSNKTISLKVNDGTFLTFDKKSVATILTEKDSEPADTEDSSEN